MTSSALDNTLRIRRFGTLSALQAPLITAAAYYLAAQIAFMIGTFSDNIFAPFWPPNIVLFIALLRAPPRRWWLFIVVTFPTHVLAELTVQMTIAQSLVAFATNYLVAGANAFVVQRFIGQSRWFESLRNGSAYILFTALIVPAFSALGGAFVQILGGDSTDKYLLFAAEWYASNAVGSLTLAPAAMLWLNKSSLSNLLGVTGRHIEAVLLAVGLIVVCAITFDTSMSIGRGYLPSVLYLPLPFVLWAAVRFGAQGASGAILVISSVLIWVALQGNNLFTTEDVESNVFALQIFLIGLSTPVLLLGAAIEEIRRAERMTRDSEERMALAAQSSSLCLWEYDVATRRFWATEFCRELFGLRPNARVDLNALLGCVHPADNRYASKMMNSALVGFTPMEIEFRLDGSGKETRWILAKAQPIFDEEGRPTSMTGTFADVTLRKAAESEAAMQRHEIAHLMRVSMLGELSGGLAHELTQPLTAILSNAQAGKLLLAGHKKNLDEVGKIFEDIITEDNRAGEVIHRLRDLLKKGEVRYETVDVGELITSTLGLLHSELINRRVIVNWEPGAHLLPVRGDPVQLQQVVLNLLMNAMDAMDEVSPSDRAILITAAAGGKDVHIQVADRGTGFPDSQNQAVFKPFFTTKKQGLGLGLSICSSIIKSHGGTLSLQNNVTKGATATFRLPVQEK